MYGDPALDRLAAQIDISNQTLMQAEAAYRQARALVRQDAVGPLSHGHRQRRLHPERQRQRREPQHPGHRASTRARAASASSRAGAALQLGDRPVGPHPPHRSKAIRRRPRPAPPTSPRRGCRRRPTWRSTTSRCASPSSACRLFEASVAAYARSLEIVQNQVDAGIVSPRRPRPGADPARADARPARRRGHQPRPVRACRRRAGRQGAGRAQRRARAGAAGRCRPSTPASPRRCWSGGPTSPRPSARWRRPTPRSAWRSPPTIPTSRSPARITLWQQPDRAAHAQQRGVVGRPAACRRR